MVDKTHLLAAPDNLKSGWIARSCTMLGLCHCK